MAGIKVVEIEDRAMPRLCLNVNLDQHKYDVSLKVVLDDLQFQLGSMATKWSHGKPVGHGAVADALNDAKKLVDEFVDDWLAVNGTA